MKSSLDRELRRSYPVGLKMLLKIELSLKAHSTGIAPEPSLLDRVLLLSGGLNLQINKAIDQ